MKKQLLVMSLLSLSLLAACNDKETVIEKNKLPVKEVETVIPTKEPVVSTETPTNQTEPNVVIDTQVVANQKKEGEVFLDLQIPVITGMKNTDKQTEMNDMFANFAAELKKDAEEAEAGLRETDSDMHAGTSLSFKTALLNEHLMSILLEGYIYTGGAHGTTFKKTYVYDFKEQKELKLSDLFTIDTYLAELHPLILKSMEKQELIDTLFASEEFTSIRKDQDFYLTEESLVFVFGQYEYTAGVAGSPEIPIEKEAVTFLKELYR